MGFSHFPHVATSGMCQQGDIPWETGNPSLGNRQRTRETGIPRRPGPVMREDAGG
jgi:hypothetical protein